MIAIAFMASCRVAVDKLAQGCRVAEGCRVAVDKLAQGCRVAEGCRVAVDKLAQGPLVCSIHDWPYT